MLRRHLNFGFSSVSAFGTFRSGRMFRLCSAFSAFGRLDTLAATPAFATVSAVSALTPTAATTPAATAAGFTAAFGALLILGLGFSAGRQFGLRLPRRAWRALLTRLTRRTLSALGTSFAFRTACAFRAFTAATLLTGLARLALFCPIDFSLRRPAVAPAAILAVASTASATPAAFATLAALTTLTTFAPGFAPRGTDAAAWLCLGFRSASFEPTHDARDDAWLRQDLCRFRYGYRGRFARGNALYGGLRPHCFGFHAGLRVDLFLGRHLHQVIAGGHGLSLIQVVVAQT